MYTIHIDNATNTASTTAEVLGVLRAKGVRVSDLDVKVIKKLSTGNTHYISGPVTRDGAEHFKATVRKDA